MLSYVREMVKTHNNDGKKLQQRIQNGGCCTVA